MPRLVDDKFVCHKANCVFFSFFVYEKCDWRTILPKLVILHEILYSHEIVYDDVKCIHSTTADHSVFFLLVFSLVRWLKT